ncbi:hypothetical protein SteCoe_579 [Stentor coeruleus]|uniref:Peptidase M14 domain-containing protein n=1 Tax=Stentor coeruleus TaxID=5963 RepID=A0A1R2D3L8_9CILI|nr:hypothetical protein SteCoe_579 [Stentor coeruleus]
MVKLAFYLLVLVTSLDLYQGTINGYLSLQDVYTLLDIYKAKYPFLELQTLGKSHFGREIKSIKIPNPNTPKILIIGAHHANELISTTNIFYLLDYILTNTTFKNTREITFIPVLNVDGLSTISDHLKINPNILEIRKNSRPTGCSIQHQGIDLNRNYGFKWAYDEYSSSEDPCNDEYRGTSAFSEKETLAIKNFIFKNTFDSIISYHSYGDYYIRPTGYAHINLTSFPQSHQNLYNNIINILPTNFKFGTVHELLGYYVNGSLMDYLYNLKIFCIEILIGPSIYNSFHPDKNMVKGILESHIEPFMMIVNKTDWNLSVDIIENGRILNVEIKNIGIASSNNTDMIIEFNKDVDVKVIKYQVVFYDKKKIIINIPSIKSENKENIMLIIEGDIRKVNMTIRFEGKQHKGFFKEVMVYGTNPRNNLMIIIIISIVCIASLILMLIVYRYCTKKKEVKFVELAEMQELA